MDAPAFSSSQVSGIRCSEGRSRIAPGGQWAGAGGGEDSGGEEGAEGADVSPLPPCLPGLPELRLGIPLGRGWCVGYGHRCTDDDAKLLSSAVILERG